MRTKRSNLRGRAAAALICFAAVGQMLAAGGAQAHGRPQSSYGGDSRSYEGSVPERPAYGRSGQGPADFRHDPTPTFSERIGTN